MRLFYTDLNKRQRLTFLAVAITFPLWLIPYGLYVFTKDTLEEAHWFRELK